MDPEQVRAEMRERRESIDRTLDRLQTRVAESEGRLTRVALRGGVLMLIPTLYRWARRRYTRHHHARASHT